MRVILDNLDTFTMALGVTLLLSLLSFAGAFLVGAALAAARVSPVPPLRQAATLLTELFRNIPLVVLLFLLYFGIPKIDIRFSPFITAVIGMSLYTGAYMGETIRSGINSVAVGQAEAARSLGLGFGQVLGIVVLPQALRTVVQPIGNLFSAHAKNTAIAASISVKDLTYQANKLGQENAEAVTTLLAVGMVYVVLLLGAGYGFAVLERRTAIRR